MLPVDGAGVLLPGADGRLDVVLASDDAAETAERAQLQAGEGPCLDAHRAGMPVLEPDLAACDRWPRYAARTRAAGFAAVFAFPLRLRGGVRAEPGAPDDGNRVGAFDLYQREARPFTAEDVDAAAVLADVATAYLLNARAITELRRTEADLRHRALHDPLTGLPNRVLLLDRLGHALASTARTAGRVAVLYVDLDDFKAVNDRLGHRAGDALLVAASRRLRHAVRPGDTLARVGGDEFVVLCDGLAGGADTTVADTTVADTAAAALAERIEATLRRPFLLGDDRVRTGASVGVAVTGDPDEDPGALLHRADTAMYDAKRRRRPPEGRAVDAVTSGIAGRVA